MTNSLRSFFSSRSGGNNPQSSQASGAPNGRKFSGIKWLKVPFVFALLLGSFFMVAQVVSDIYDPKIKYPENARPTVTSDKEDYSPGQIAYITGEGWTLDDSVHVHFEEFPAPADHHEHNYHLKATRDGKWVIEYPIEERHLGVAFEVIATGNITGDTAMAHFTDGEAQIKSISKTVISTSNPGSIRITTVNAGVGGIDIGVRIRRGGKGSNNDLVWESDYFKANNSGTEINFTWNGFSNQGSYNGSRVPDGEYYIIAVEKKEETNKGVKTITYLETTREVSPPIYGKANIDFAPLAFKDLTESTIIYGANSITLSGSIASGSYIPQGNVAISLNGVTQNAAINASTGEFSTSFNTASLAVAASPYTIKYYYEGDNFYAGILDETKRLTITPGTLTIKAENASRAYGEANPTFVTSVVSGAKNGETFTVTALAATATATSAAGSTHDIVPSAEGTTLANYTVVPQNGVLTVRVRPVTVVAEAKSKYCGIADPAFTYSLAAATVDGVIYKVYDEVGFRANVAGSLQRIDKGEVVGRYAITSTLDNRNYAITYVGADLTIKGLTVDASNASIPRSKNEPITIAVSLSDGNTNASDLVGIPLTLLVNDAVVGQPVNSVLINGKAGVNFSIGTYATNVYKVQVIAGSRCSVSDVVYMPVFDPEAGFVTGGGWVMAPGNSQHNVVDGGRANFGFVAKYRKGLTKVDGNTEFQFVAGGLSFKSNAHSDASLVISNGKATFRGTGHINNDLNTLYDFLVVVHDSEINGKANEDRFRIKISRGGEVIFDNEKKDDNADLTADGSFVRGGSIVIHNPTNGKKSTISDEVYATNSVAKVTNYPNPFSGSTTIEFTVEKSGRAVVEVYNQLGQKVASLFEGEAVEGEVYSVELNTANLNLASGMYITRMVQNGTVTNHKMMLKR